MSTGDAVGAEDLLAQLGPVPVLSALLERLEPDGIGEGPAAIGVAASVIEFALGGPAPEQAAGQGLRRRPGDLRRVTAVPR